MFYLFCSIKNIWCHFGVRYSIIVWFDFLLLNIFFFFSVPRSKWSELKSTEQLGLLNTIVFHSRKKEFDQVQLHWWKLLVGCFWGVIGLTKKFIQFFHIHLTEVFGQRKIVCNAGDLGSIPGLRRSPGEGQSYSLQYSGLENSMDCVVHGVAKSQTWLSNFHLK